MKVAYVTMQFPCASETFFARDIIALKKAGLSVSIFALKPTPKNETSLRSAHKTEDISAKSINLLRYLKGIFLCLKNYKITTLFVYLILTKEKNFADIFRILLLIPSYFWCTDEIEKISPDIIHLFWGHYPSAISWILSKKKGGAATKTTMFLGAYDLQKDLFLTNLGASHCAVLFTHAHDNVNIIKIKTGHSYVEAIHRGIDTEEIDSIQNAGNKRDPFSLIYVGRLIEEKGVNYILEAMPVLKKKHYSLNIIGDGPFLENLKKLCEELGIQDCVKFTGYLEPTEVYKKLFQSRFFIMPSHSAGERLPNAVKEAMYTGTIPIVSNTPGIKELIRHEENGFILQTISAEFITDAVISLSNHKNIDGISQAAKETIFCSFDVRKSMSNYIRIWSAIIKT